MSLGNLETLPRRKSSSHDNILRSQKSDIFPKSTKIKWKTSKMVLIPNKIQHSNVSHARNKDGAIRCIIQKTRSYPRK